MINSYISKLDQYHFEHLTWERMLDFFKQENAFLKTRLSQVLDRKIDNEFLALAEQFQNQFIIKDDFIDELKHDINEMERAVKESTVTMKIVPDIKVENKHNKLRNEMEYLEKNFAQLKNEFNKYLVSVL
jgi:L-lactate utilization protein LutC